MWTRKEKEREKAKKRHMEGEKEACDRRELERDRANKNLKKKWDMEGEEGSACKRRERERV